MVKQGVGSVPLGPAWAAGVCRHRLPHHVGGVSLSLCPVSLT